MKHNEKITTAGIIIFVLIILIWSISDFLTNLNQNIKETTNFILIESYGKQNIDGSISVSENLTDSLNILAEKISKSGSINSNKINLLLNNTMKQNIFSDIVIIDIDGKILDGNDESVRSNTYFINALNKQTSIDKYYNSLNDSYAYITVPIIQNDSVIGILRGTYNLNQIGELIINQHEYITKITLRFILKIFLAFMIITTYNLVLLRNKTLISKHKNMQLDALTSNIPGGVQCCETDNDFTIKYLSDSFLNLTGFTRDEIAINFNNKYIKMIYPTDRECAVNTMNHLTTDFFELQYRLIRKDGVIIWILDKGQIVRDSHGNCEYYCILVDISDFKRTEKDLLKSRREIEICNERYQIVINQSGSIIFDYDHSTDTVFISDLFRKIFGYNPPYENFPNSFIYENIIHLDDLEEFNDFCISITNGEQYYENELRLVSSKGEYIWCSIQANNIFDKDGVSIRTIGRITDISKRKSETLRNIEKYQVDELTKLLNKQTARSFIDGYLFNHKENQHALILLEIINFDKIIEVDSSKDFLLDLLNRLTKQFRSTDIIARLSYNIFGIFVKDCSKELIIKKASDICILLETSRITDFPYIIAESNIGISFSTCSDTYNDLYKKAAAAMADTINNGKNI